MNISIQIWKCAVVAASFLGFSCSTTFAQNAPEMSASTPAAVPNSADGLGPRFDVASVRQNLSPEPSWRMSFTDNGVSAKDVTLLYALEEAYGLYDEQLWSATPPWIGEKRFDIEAKYDVEKYPQVTLGQRRAMLQQLLAERFKLVVHHEQREFPVYALVIARGGPKFAETKSQDLYVSSTYGQMCQVLRSKLGLIELKGCSMTQLAHNLTDWTHNDLGRTIIDHTGLNGRYSFSLSWTPDDPSSNSLDAREGPSIFTAVKEQLGLLLQSEKGLLDAIVIDHVEMPSEN